MFLKYPVLNVAEFLIRLSPYVVVFALILAALWILYRQFRPRGGGGSNCHKEALPAGDKPYCGIGGQCEHCPFYNQYSACTLELPAQGAEQMNEEIPITAANEDYLEAIFNLAKDNRAVRSVDIARHLAVTRASVNRAVNILKSSGLIRQAPYGAIHLTEKGEKIAEDIRQRHQMLKRFLTEVLEVSDETAEEDACKMEHIISQETRAKWLYWLEERLAGGD